LLEATMKISRSDGESILAETADAISKNND